MSRLRGLARLCRISNLPTVWTNVLAATVLSGGNDLLRQFPVLALSMSLLYAGGMALNDVIDADQDRLTKPHRPIPSKEVEQRHAVALVIGLLGAGFSLLVFASYPRHALVSGTSLVATIVAYDLLHRKTSWSIILMASCRGLVFVTVTVATTATVSFPAAVAGILQFLYVLVVSATARFEKSHPFSWPVVPAMIAGISVIDGILISVWQTAAGLAIGAVAAVLTLSGQRAVPGD